VDEPAYRLFDEKSNLIGKIDFLVAYYFQLWATL